ncbi:MAG TPA: immunoglobulin domain-containing protein, partial [Candidatus Saccharimonadales bacterium]|nr:immunoglobulin domain-containing protein [Candidatus Saccharimonadales bacterium]
MNLLPTSIRRSREGCAGWSVGALAALAVAWLSGAQPAPAQLAPFITQEPTDRIALTGGTVSFTVGVTGDSPLTYQWYHNFLQLIPEGTNATLVLTNVRPADAGTYDVQITNPFGSANSREAVLVVRTPPTLLVPPASQVVTQGQSVSLTVSVIGDAPLGFQWFLNGTNALPGATNSLLGFANVQSTNTGDYSVLITNVAGSVVSPPATLTVLSPPTFLHPPLTILTAAGSTVVLSADVAGDLPLAFQWVLNGTNVLAQATNATLTLTSVQLNDAGAYSVQVTNGVGSLEGLAATLTVLVAPVIRADPVSLVVTQGRPASFTVDATGSAPLSYRWFFNGAGVLRGTNATLSFSSAQAADGGTYQVTVSNVLGIATSAPAVLTVRVPPAILQQPFGLTVPPGGTAQFTVLALGDEPLAYQWMFNGSDLPGATNSLLLLTNVASAAAGTYSARVSNPVGSALSVGALLVIKPPPAIAQQPASLVVTQGNAASFTVVAGGDGPFTYQWFLNADPITNATAATYSIPLALPAHAGAYTVRVSSD